MNFGKMITVMKPTPDQEAGITRTQQAFPSPPSGHSFPMRHAILISNTIDTVLPILISFFKILFID